MSSLQDIFLERISSGLKRQALSDAARWAEAYRVMSKPFPGKWTFRRHPWLKEIHLSRAESNNIQKAAQLGLTETVLNITFYKIDIERVDCLYVLPAKTPDASDFSAARFDPALELSTHLANLFSEVKNIGHKRAGTTNLYIRGSKSKAGLKSIPVGLVVLDELDEMNQENVTMATERTSGQKEKQIFRLSTPTIDNYGINKFYIDSTQESYFFKCPACNRYTQLIFPDSLEITAKSLDDPNIRNTFLKCKECKARLDHETKHEWLANKYDGGSGDWVPEYSNRSERGFHINQLYSTTVSPIELARSYLRSLNDPTDEQSFYNDKLGLTHIVEGAKLTDHLINQCKGDYLNGTVVNQSGIFTTMGVDVGKWLHYEVTTYKLISHDYSADINVQAHGKVIEIGKVLDFNELDLLMQKHRIMFCVIDANPERRKAYEFATRFWGHVKLCFYGMGIRDRQVQQTKTGISDTNSNGNNEPTITVDRTSWLDMSLGRFRNKTINIPSNTPLEYFNHLKALTRIYEKDRDGNPFGRYVRGNVDDHYAHARNYNEIALAFAAHISNPHNIRSPI